MEKHLFRHWWNDHKGMVWLFVSQRYKDIYPWYRPARYVVGGIIKELFYYLKCRLWKKYNTVTAKTLPPTWSDAVERIIHINFAILCDVVEKEKIFENNAAEGDPTDGESWAWALKEMHELYTWWKVDRPARLKAEDEAMNAWSGARGPFVFVKNETGYEMTTPEAKANDRELLYRVNELEDAGDEEDTAQLVRLMKVRRYLWT